MNLATQQRRYDNTVEDLKKQDATEEIAEHIRNEISVSDVEEFVKSLVPNAQISINAYKHLLDAMTIIVDETAEYQYLNTAILN